MTHASPRPVPIHRSDLESYFLRHDGGEQLYSKCLRFEDAGVLGRFDDLLLSSVFQPLFDCRTLAPAAHEALLRVKRDDGGILSPQQAFDLPKTPKEFVFFDRLCRTVHALNFVSQAESSDLLFLNVDGRHLLNVGGGQHGSAFETILNYCGLNPSQVVIEVLESRVPDLDRLIEALAAYQARGYRIAIDDFGCQHSNFDRLWRLSPDIVKLDRSLIVESTANPRARRVVPKLIEIIHDLGAKVVCEGVETFDQHLLAFDAGSDLVQGFYYARPAPAMVGPKHRIEAPLQRPPHLASGF